MVRLSPSNIRISAAIICQFRYLPTPPYAAFHTSTPFPSEWRQHLVVSSRSSAGPASSLYTHMLPILALLTFHSRSIAPSPPSVIPSQLGTKWIFDFSLNRHSAAVFCFVLRLSVGSLVRSFVCLCISGHQYLQDIRTLGSANIYSYASLYVVRFSYTFVCMFLCERLPENLFVSRIAMHLFNLSRYWSNLDLIVKFFPKFDLKMYL